jgi:hypothetical protein
MSNPLLLVVIVCPGFSLNSAYLYAGSVDQIIERKLTWIILNMQSHNNSKFFDSLFQRGLQFSQKPVGKQESLYLRSHVRTGYQHATSPTRPLGQVRT